MRMCWITGILTWIELSTYRECYLHWCTDDLRHTSPQRLPSSLARWQNSRQRITWRVTKITWHFVLWDTICVSSQNDHWCTLVENLHCWRVITHFEARNYFTALVSRVSFSRVWRCPFWISVDQECSNVTFLGITFAFCAKCLLTCLSTNIHTILEFQIRGACV